MPKRPYIPKRLREKIERLARHRCGYCLTPQSFTAIPMHLDHIIPCSCWRVFR